MKPSVISHYGVLMIALAMFIGMGIEEEFPEWFAGLLVSMVSVGFLAVIGGSLLFFLGY